MIRNGHIPSSGRLACRFRVRRPAARNGLHSGGGDISTLNIGKRRKKTKRRLPKSSIIVMCSGCGGCPPCDCPLSVRAAGLLAAGRKHRVSAV